MRALGALVGTPPCTREPVNKKLQGLGVIRAAVPKGGGVLSSEEKESYLTLWKMSKEVKVMCIHICISILYASV